MEKLLAFLDTELQTILDELDILAVSIEAITARMRGLLKELLPIDKGAESLGNTQPNEE